MPTKGIKIHLVGARFGRLVVLAEAGLRGRRNRYLLCRCDCGTEKEIAYSSLRLGGTTSCGCYHREVIRKTNSTHGMSGCGPEYDVWVAIKARCGDPKNISYKNYGARGITLCARWEDVRNFIGDMGPRPTEKHSIERKNNNGPYSPDNCIWGTKDQQVNNTRRNRILIVRDQKFTCKQASIAFGIEYQTLRQRLRLGWSHERAVFIPVDTSLAHNRKRPRL